jgi:hypothetical protein
MKKAKQGSPEEIEYNRNIARAKLEYGNDITVSEFEEFMVRQRVVGTFQSKMKERQYDI